MSKIKKIILVFFSFIIIFSLILSVPTSALSPQYTFDFPISKPPVDEHSILMEILYSNDGGNTVRAEIVYGLLPYELYYNSNTPLTETSHIMVTINKSNFIVSSGADNTGLAFRFSWFYMKDNGQMYFLNSAGNSFSQGLGQIIGVHVYGGAFVTDNHGSLSSGSNFVFNYGTDALMEDKLDSVIAILRNSNQIVIDNANQNASQIQQNQDENTDKIIENQQQMQENEKNEAESQGQGSVDEIGSAIEDKSAGFISAIGSLVNSMSYNGTACAWSFPALKLPAIEGVMPEYQLTQEQPIDFEYWVNKIPSDILLLVRSLLTIALIVYCFKELYSTISYVLTLKGGGNSE